jgi:hypothetical protein
MCTIGKRWAQYSQDQISDDRWVCGHVCCNVLPTYLFCMPCALCQVRARHLDGGQGTNKRVPRTCFHRMRASAWAKAADRQFSDLK